MTTLIGYRGGAVRVVGRYGSGKTTMLRNLAEHHPGALVVCATEAAAAAFGAAATTFWRLAADIVARHDRPVRILSTEEHRALVGDIEAADTMCHYRASFLGLEELRTHAHAAGVAETWERLGQLSEEHAADMAGRGESDWAGVLVRASLLLRDDAVLAAERDRFDLVIVDDFESASFATNRLLTQLVGRGGDVVVAGNVDNPVWRHVAGSPSYLERFCARMDAADVRLTTPHRHPGMVTGGQADVTVVVEPGGDPWVQLSAVPSPDPMPVALAASLEWERVRVIKGAPCAEHTSYDLDLLGGPDVPDDAVRAERRRREDHARLAMALSRATQLTVQPWSR